MPPYDKNETVFKANRSFEPFGLYPLRQRLWRCQLPQRGSQEAL